MAFFQIQDGCQDQYGIAILTRASKVLMVELQILVLCRRFDHDECNKGYISKLIY